MNILNDTKAKFINLKNRMRRATDDFIRLTSKVRSDINSDLATCQGFFADAGADGLAFLLMSNNSVASNNELELLQNLTTQEALLIAGAAKNIATGKDVNDGLPTLSNKIKLLAQSHVISSQINMLNESNHSAESPFILSVQNDGSVLVSEKLVEEPENV